MENSRIAAGVIFVFDFTALHPATSMGVETFISILGWFSNSKFTVLIMTVKM